MTVHPLFGSEDGERRVAPAGRAATLSAQIVAEVREALNEKRLKPGDFLGGEKDIAKRLGVSRIVARDALRTLEALGVVEIKVGAGGGARVARGNPRLFADALAVQLDLAGATAREIMDAQRAVETLAAELAAENATEADHAKLRRLLDEGEAAIDDHDRYTRALRAVPSRGRRGIAQSRARRAAHVAAAYLVAEAQPHADAHRRAPYSGRASRAARR